MSSLPAPVEALLALFQGPLANVRFADVDAAALSHLVNEVESASVEAERQQLKLAELQHALAQQQEALLVLAQRALAYARVYAENDEALTHELNRIALPRPTKPRKASSSKSSEAGPESSAAQREPAPTLPEEAFIDQSALVDDPELPAGEAGEAGEAERFASAPRKIKRRAKSGLPALPNSASEGGSEA